MCDLYTVCNYCSHNLFVHGSHQCLYILLHRQWEALEMRLTSVKGVPCETTYTCAYTYTHTHATGSVLGVCMCHPPTQDSLKLWLGALQETYPILAHALVVYNIKEPSTSKIQHRQLQDSHVTSIAETTSV